MTDQRIERARDALASDVDERKVQALWRRIEGGRRAKPSHGRRRPNMRVILAAAMTLGLLASGGALGWSLTRSEAGPLRLADGSPLPSALEATRTEIFRFDDGSQLELAAGSHVDLLDTTPQNVRLALRGGQVVFRVRPHGPRRWEIECGPLSIEVVGTVFTVDRDGDHVEVHVQRGAVLVHGDRVPDHVQRLSAGQSLAMPPAPQLPAPLEEEAEALEPVAAPVPDPTRDAQRAARPGAVWREHLAAGRYDEAYDALGEEGFLRETARAQRVDDLMRLADLARLSGHPDDALLPLERIVDRHSSSGSAAIAAYTLGRLRLERLGDPGGAVVALQRSLAMGLPAALQEPARARLVRALRSDGDPRMDAAGRRYLELHPEGPSADVIRGWLE